MPWRICIWTDESVAHLAEHGVSQDEFEAILAAPEGQGVTRSTGRPFCEGFVGGRWLFCVYNEIDDVYVEPVTAYEIER